MSGEEDAPDVQVVLCTVPSPDEGARIARALLEERLVACVNVLPGLRSIYRWQGQVEEAQETLLVMKTTRQRYVALEAKVRALHPYEVCEVLALDVPDGSLPYLSWVRDETR